MTRVGILGPLSVTRVAQQYGADYVEPTIVGNIALLDDDGIPRANPAFAGERFGSFAVLVPGTLQVADPSVPIDDIERYFRAVFEVIAGVATPGAKVVFGSGASRTIPDGVSRADGEERFARSLEIARDAAAEHDIQVMLEPLHRGESNLVNSIAEAVAFLDRHDIPGVTIVADYYHIELEAEELSVVAAHVDRIGHAHLADDERRWLGAGEGEWPEFVRVLRTAGYTGPISVEARWTETDLDAEVSASIAALRAADPV
jgi:D-psicose/D-tagatose/L-ribulose 3-epimerase